MFGFGRNNKWKKIAGEFGLRPIEHGEVLEFPPRNRWFLDKRECKVKRGAIGNSNGCAIVACDFGFKHDPSTAEAVSTLVAGGVAGSSLARNVVLFKSCVVVRWPAPVQTVYALRPQSMMGGMFSRIAGKKSDTPLDGFLAEPKELDAAKAISPRGIQLLQQRPKRFLICTDESCTVIANASHDAGGPSGNSMSDVRMMVEIALALSNR